MINFVLGISGDIFFDKGRQGLMALDLLQELYELNKYRFSCVVDVDLIV